MTRRRSQHHPQKKSKKSQQTMYLAVTGIIIVAAIAGLIFLQDHGEPDPDGKDNTDIPNTDNSNDGTWLFAMDTDNIGSKYQASAIPTLAIIDINGDIVYYNRGVHTKDQLLPYIESAAEGSAESMGEAPDFTVTTFDDKTFKLSDNEGKVVVIDLMAEYCSPCKDQMPELQKIKLEKGDEVVILSIDVAYPNESEELIRSVFEQYIKE